MPEVTLCRWSGKEAGDQLDRVLPVYEEVYAEPPYREGPREVADFLERFHRQVRLPGFRMVVASEGETVVGFAFGFLLPPDTKWWDALLEPAPEEFTRETGTRTFALIELAVRKPWRRQGIASRMHAQLLDGLPAERVTLTMRPEPEAEPAHRAYAAWGYRSVGRSQPWDDAPIYIAMVLDLDIARDTPKEAG